jgi:hypothetical protein
VPVGEYCLLLFLSSFANPQEALEHLAVAVQQLQRISVTRTESVIRMI